MDCSLPGSSVYGISQARVLKWAAISFSKASSQHGDQTRISCIAGGFFTTEPPGKPVIFLLQQLKWTKQHVLNLKGFRGHNCAAGANKCLRADETVPTQELWGQGHASACVERALLIKPLSVLWTPARFKFEESWAWVANLPPLPAPPRPTGLSPFLPVASPSYHSRWKLPDQGLLWLTQPCGGPVGNCMDPYSAEKLPSPSSSRNTIDLGD